MKNKLTDLQNHLFAAIEKVLDDDLTGEELKEYMERSRVFNELAKTAVANGALMAKCADMLYGIPVSDEVPLIPKSDGDTYLAGNNKKLITFPRDDGASGYKKGRRQPI